MIFSRTPSGLFSFHRFHRVDLVIFTEGGGENVPPKNFTSKLSESGSLDEFFWRTIFNSMPGSNRKKLKFISVGSKEGVKGYAKIIEERDINTIAVAMDADFDVLTGDALLNRQIIYTRGYSIENDVFQPSVVLRVIDRFSIDENAKREAKDIVLRVWNEMESGVRRWIFADALMVLVRSSLFDRCKPRKFVEVTLNGPCLNARLIESRLKEFRQKFGRFRLIKAINLKDAQAIWLFGKLQACFAVCLVSFAAAQAGLVKKKLPEDFLEGQFFIVFREMIEERDLATTYEYYRNSTEALL